MSWNDYFTALEPGLLVPGEAWSVAASEPTEFPPPELAGTSPLHWPEAGGVPVGEQTRNVLHLRLPVAASKASR